MGNTTQIFLCKEKKKYLVKMPLDLFSLEFYVLLPMNETQ